MKRFLEGLALCAVVYVIIMGAGMLLSKADAPSNPIMPHWPQAPRELTLQAVRVLMITDGEPVVLSCSEMQPPK